MVTSKQLEMLIDQMNKIMEDFNTRITALEEAAKPAAKTNSRKSKENT